MVHMALNISDDLAERLRPLGVWLPTALELTLVGCKTVAAATATEVLEFLAQGPTPRGCSRITSRRVRSSACNAC